MFRRDPIFPHDALSPWETQVPASPQAWVARAFCVLVALCQRDELSLGKDVIWKSRAQECPKCGIAVMVEADLTIRSARFHIRRPNAFYRTTLRFGT